MIDSEVALESLDGLNAWLAEKGLPGVQSGEDCYSSATYIEGDFSESVKEAQRLVDKWYAGGFYNVLINNCMQVATNLIMGGEFEGKWWINPVLNEHKNLMIPNASMHIVAWVFGNTSFKK